MNSNKTVIIINWPVLITVSFSDEISKIAFLTLQPLFSLYVIVIEVNTTTEYAGFWTPTEHDI